MQAQVEPAQLPVTVSVDGPVAIDPAEGLTWSGTYSVIQVTTAEGQTNGNANAGDAANGPTGWRSDGAFKLTGDQLDISKAVLSNGPVDRPLSVAGTLLLNFGKSPSFAATAEANQIDLDRTLGKGPRQPVDVAAAVDSLVAWLSRLPVPDEPGSIRFHVPTIVVGGRIIEDLAVTAAPAKGGWRIGTLRAKLPGQATLDASGLMTTSKKFGFDGQTHLAVYQPSTFATWWRGKGEEGAGRLLAPFDLSGHAQIGPNLVSFDHATARIDSATVTGNFSWGEDARDHRRKLVAVLDSKGLIDFVQLKALAELLVGHNLTNVGALADDYSLQVAADAFAYGDLTVKGIQINADYRDDALIVTRLQVDDIGGAKIEKTNGEIDKLSGNPRGHLYTTLYAPKLTGLARLADRFLPQSGFTRWLDAAAPSLGEAVIKANITAPLPNGGNGFAFTVNNGTAASTTISSLSAAFTGGFAHWRTRPAEITAKLYSPDGAELARQLGLAAVALTKDQGGSVDVAAKGVPADGLDTVVMTELAGLNATARGKLTVGEDLAPSFKGTVDANSDNIAPVAAMAGFDIPGPTPDPPLWLDKASLDVSGQGLDLNLKNAKVGPAIVSGNVTLEPDGAGGWRIGGKVVADKVDLGWIAALGLGLAPTPSGDPANPWSHFPFSAPAFGAVTGTLQVTADRLDVDGLGITSPSFTLSLRPQHVDVALTKGQLAGGTVTGNMHVHNVGGNVNLTGGFDLKGAALESFVWRRDGRSVATGTLDLSANFQSTGRSAAGLISTMTGGGVLTIHDGVARYVNPNTVRQIVRASDLGQQFSEDALRTAFSERIDADNLTFKEASTPFAIVAGAVRLKNLMVKTKGLAATGNAVIDLNTMTLDSDWNLVFDPVDNKVQGVDPEAGIVFHGPIAAPTRTVDVLPFAAYLNEREAARMNEIIALDAASREEKQRLNRLVDKLKQDAVQRIEDARIAAEREKARHDAVVAEVTRLQAFHISREAYLEKRHVEALAALADRLVAAQKQAQAIADQAAQAASQARAKADAAAKALAEARAADKAAADKAAATAADLAQAKAAADSASRDAKQSAGAADQAKQALAAATTAEAKAKAAADAAAQAKTAADKALQAATDKVAAATSALGKANDAVASTKAAKDDADKAAAAATTARDAAQSAFAGAEAAVKDAQAKADAAASQATTAGGEETAAEAVKKKADAEVKAAADALKTASAARDDATAKLKDAQDAAAKAQKAADSAATAAQQAADLAKVMTANAGADAQAVATAKAMQTAADSAAQLADAKRIALDAANKVVAEAQAALKAAEQAVADAGKRSETAVAAAAQADAAVKTAAASAGHAADVKTAALTVLDEKTKARDAAKATRDDKEAALQKATAEAQAAAKAAADAATAAESAQANLQAASAAKATAEKTLAVRTTAADEKAKAAQAATAKRVAAASDAKAAADKADKAASASAAARQTLAARKAADDAAQAKAEAAAKARQTREASAAAADAQAQKDEAAAKIAEKQAADAAAAAEAAQQTAAQAAEAMNGAGPSGTPVPPSTGKGASAAPAGTTVAADPVPTAPVAAPRQRPKIVPLPKVPSVLPTDAPLRITPPYQ